MAKPTKPKDLKPKVEGEAPATEAAAGGGGLDMKMIIIGGVMIIASLVGSAGAAYLMTSMFVMPEITKLAHSKGGDAGTPDAAPAAPEAPHTVGMNLELDEFTVNLKADPTLGGSQFLRAKIALSIKVPDKENCYATKASRPFNSFQLALASGQLVGAAAPVSWTDDNTLLAEEGTALSCDQVFKNNMGKFVPTIRDVVNAALMKRNASALATLEGQEALKDEIKEQLSQILAPNYEVLRVNFQDFIIQK